MMKSLDELVKVLRPRSIEEPCQQGITDLSQLPSIWDVEGKVVWLVDGLIARGSVTLISSEAGTGKTWLAYYIAGCVAHGKQVLGRATEQAPVLYVDGENPVSVGKRNLSEMGIEKTASLNVWGGWCTEQPKGPSDERVQQFADQHKGLIIYDSLVQFHPGDEQSASDTRPYMDQYRRLANLGATVIILHHTGKSENAQEYRGSSDIKAAVDMAYVLEERSKNNGKLGRLALKNYKARLAASHRSVIGLEFRQGVGFVDWNAPAPPPSPLDAVVEIVGRQPGQNQGEVVKAAMAGGVSKATAEKILKENWGNRFRVETGKGASKLYYLADAPPPPAAEPPAPAEEVLV